MTEITRSPAQLRRMFGENLRYLVRSYPSVSEVCRQLGINRTQFNRYLAGESFPRPDVLDRICGFFAVDARILLKPLDEIEASTDHPASKTLDHFLAAGNGTLFETGFYHAVETDPEGRYKARHRLLLVRRVGHCALLRSYEPRTVMPDKSASLREVQGIVSHTGSQVYALMSRQGGQDCRMMMLTRKRKGADRFWSGHVMRLPDRAPHAPNVQQLELHHLARDIPAALRVARGAPHGPSDP